MGTWRAIGDGMEEERRMDEKEKGRENREIGKRGRKEK